MKKALLAAAVACMVMVAAVLGLIVMVIGGQPEPAAAADELGGCFTPGSSVTQVSTSDLDAEQRKNAATIISVGRDLRVPERGLVVAIATAMQESTLRNLDHGDRDSVGLFQQRAPWGSFAERTNPAKSARMFFTGGSATSDGWEEPGLIDIAGWQGMEVWEAAQAVQASGFPYAYAKWEDLALKVVSSSRTDTGATPVVGGCGGSKMCPDPGLPMMNGLTPDARIVASCTVQKFGITNVLGVGERAANSASDHPAGRAVDVMIANYASAQGRAQGDKVAEWVRANARAMGVNYIIWNARIWSVQRAQEGWRAYTHPSGATDDNSAHRNHVHVSVYGNAAVVPVSTGSWVQPIAGAVTMTARFGECSELWSACHTGDDYAEPSGTPIRATADGTVTFVAWGGAYGNLTKISHGGGIETWYAHQTSQSVRVGQKVTAGQRIGTVGATGNVTGPHLHLEVRRNGQPLNPATWLAAHAGRPAPGSDAA